VAGDLLGAGIIIIPEKKERKGEKMKTKGIDQKNQKKGKEKNGGRAQYWSGR